MSLADTPESSLIPLTAAEALWEWHIPSDTLFLSQGTCHALGILSDIPRTMTAFLAHLPEHVQAALQRQREHALNSTRSSFAESMYPFDALFVCERMFILARDIQGRALWAMGQYVISTTSLSAPLLEPAQKTQGFWLYSLESKTISVDTRCAAMLGYPAQCRRFTVAEWRNLLYEEETSPDMQRHQFIIAQSLMGDIIKDTITLKTPDGSYRRLLLRGAVLERNEKGIALSVTGILQNMENVRTVKEQQQENERLLFALNATGDGLWDWDVQTGSVYFSPRYLSMLGYTAQDFPSRLDVWKSKIHPDDRDKIVLPQESIAESPQHGDSFECTYRMLRADGTWAWILGRGYVSHRDATGRAVRIVGMHTDVTILQNGKEELEDLVKNDTLTGLRSRNYCDMELERLEREGTRPVSIIACDVCGLKLINDYMGHAEGDKLLSKTAMRLRYPLRATDCAARTGGDEFVILLPGCPKSKAQEILRQIEEHFNAENCTSHDIPALVSFGLATTEDRTVSIARALITADRNMLRNKQLFRKQTHRRIKKWIEQSTQKCVSLKDSRYES